MPRGHGRPAARRRRRHRHATAPPTSTAPTTSRPCRPTSSSWRCGSSPTAWATCSTCSTRRALSNQQDVVRNERRQSVENRPYGIVEEALFHHALPEGPSRTTRRSSARTPTSRRAKLDDVQNFFKRYYGPNNASLVDRRRHRQGQDARARREVLRQLASARAAWRSRRWRRRRSRASGAWW